MITLIGLTAACFTSFSLYPQLHKSFKSKHVNDLSLKFLILLTIGLLLWLIYGILLFNLPIMIGNSIGITSCISLLILKIKYERRKK